MTTGIKDSIRLAMISLCLLASLFCQPILADTYKSPTAITATHDGSLLIVANNTANEINYITPADMKITKTIALDDSPRGLITTKSGKLLVVAGLDKGKLITINLASGAIEKTLPIGYAPTSPVLSSDESLLYVCNQFNNNIAIINLNENKLTGTIAVAREPVAAAMTPDGKTLFVANMLPYGRADKDYASAVVSVIDTATQKVTKSITLPNGSMNLQGITISPDGQFAYVTHILARYQLPTTQLERGWINTNALSIIDIASQSLVNTPLLDDVDLGAANPWAITCTTDGSKLIITHAGTHEISIINRNQLHERLNAVAAGKAVTSVSTKAENVPNDLSFMTGIRRRIKLNGTGPRALTLIGNMAYIANYFSDNITVLDINSANKHNLLALGTAKPDKVRQGEIYFHDASLCFQHWQSCTSCHPGEARVDALNWDLLNDGIGNPKNTKSMLFAHQTPPAMSLGVRDKAETAVRAGIRYIQFAVRPDEDAQAIDEYLKSLRPLPSPNLVNGQLSETAKRGETIFNNSGCASCHSGPYKTDLGQYNVGTGLGREKDKTFDTPMLVELWRTGPYLHDGRAVTVKEVLKEYNQNDMHGSTSSLKDNEIDDLAAYLLSL